MHMVFYNTIYCSFQEAASKSDGLAVVAVFLQVFYFHLFNSYKFRLNRVKHRFIKRPLFCPSKVARLVPDLVFKNAPYYTYKGSLTTPPCYESVQWIVMINPISVTESQVRSLVQGLKMNE
ncbi:carbonic anhydrase 2-like [Orbicella faveolata]|uniref:carbonic anhydrase 2-like n=1 Tax=Orbicella faveolata TaxID=48498 RepID=UPI0009E21D16|nr:carbonic anhydrase 2-like [Orbicella faveolata]